MEGEGDRDSMNIFISQQSLCCPAEERETAREGVKKINILIRKKEKSFV